MRRRRRKRGRRGRDELLRRRMHRRRRRHWHHLLTARTPIPGIVPPPPLHAAQRLHVLGHLRPSPLLPPLGLELRPPTRGNHGPPRVHRRRLPILVGVVQLRLARRRRAERVQLLVVVHARVPLDEPVLGLVQLLHALHRPLRRDQLLLPLGGRSLGLGLALDALCRDYAELLLEALELLRLVRVEPRLGIVAVALALEEGDLGPDAVRVMFESKEDPAIREAMIVIDKDELTCQQRR